MDEVCRLASPVPQLLFLPPFESDDFWMTGAELHPFQDRLSLDAKLTDLSALPGELDEVFDELLTTEGLLIIITERPFTPPKPRGAVWFRRHSHRHYIPPDESFWIKNLPVPSALRSMAFTRDLLLEEDNLSMRATTRFCSSWWPSVFIIHENTI